MYRLRRNSEEIDVDDAEVAALKRQGWQVLAMWVDGEPRVPFRSLAKAAPKASHLPVQLRERGALSIEAARTLIETANGTLPQMVSSMRQQIEAFDRAIDEKAPAATVERLLDEIENLIRGAAFQAKMKADAPRHVRELFGGGVRHHHGV